MSNKPTDLVDRVLPCDVLLGRGKSIHYHPGNVEYREIVKARSCDYAHMKGIERDRLTREVVEQVESRGGRFLKPRRDGSSQWTTCSWSVVVTKVKQALRDMVKHKATAAAASAQARSTPGKTKRLRREAIVTDKAAATGGATEASVELSPLLLGRTGLTNTISNFTGHVEPTSSATPGQHHHLNLHLANWTPTAMQNSTEFSLAGLAEANRTYPVQSSFTPLSTSLIQVPSFPTSFAPSGNVLPSSSNSITQPIDRTTTALLVQRAMLLQQLQEQTTTSHQSGNNPWTDMIELLQRTRPPLGNHDNI